MDMCATNPTMSRMRPRMIMMVAPSLFSPYYGRH
jgi:hypothetical protein